MGGTAHPLGSATVPDRGPDGAQSRHPNIGDLKAQGCEQARGVGTAGGGLTPANASRTPGGPTAGYAGHGRPSKWLTPAPWLAPALPSVAICLRLPSLGLVATCPPARPPAHPAPLHLARLSLLTALAWRALDDAEGTGWAGRGIGNPRRCGEGRPGAGETGPADWAGGSRRPPAGDQLPSQPRCRPGPPHTLAPPRALPGRPPSWRSPAERSAPRKRPPSACG